MYFPMHCDTFINAACSKLTKNCCLQLLRFYIDGLFLSLIYFHCFDAACMTVSSVGSLPSFCHYGLSDYGITFTFCLREMSC